jgi:hypothetical protein
MIAYNTVWLGNLIIQSEIEDAFDEHVITKVEKETITAKYRVGFYTPDIFIRIGLFILTIIVMVFTYGFLLLLFMNDIEQVYGTLAIVLAVIGYLALEYMINVRKHYRSGVDDGLLWASSFALPAGLIIPYHLSELTICIITFVISFCASLRYADRLMAGLMFFSMSGILFYSFLEAGGFARAIVPFVLMAASVIVYFASKKLQANNKFLYYSDCLKMICITSLAGFYVAGNYYVVREFSNTMFQLNLKQTDSIPFGWLFWIFTIITPLIYIAGGFQKKDPILLRVGLLLIVAIVFTIRYYHSILPLEILMTIGGILMFVSGYGLMKFLHEPRFGFTYRDISQKHLLNKLNIESIIIAETFVPGTQKGGTKFEGGNFGGGGASGEF